MRRSAVRISAVLVLFLGTAAALRAEEGDHPLISRYPGSSLNRTETSEYGEYTIVTGYDEEATEPTGIPLTGRSTRNGYQNPKERSTLEIYTNYLQALEKAGAEILFTCANQECGPSWASSKWNRLNGITTFTPQDARYVAAKLTGPEGGAAYVAVMVGKHRHSIDVVEITEMEEGLVVVDAAALGRGLDTKGYVIVEGIFFDTDKAVLKPESKPALAEAAALMKNRSDLKVYVVGHTDMTGTLDHNLALSRDRARAVVDALVNEHDVDRARLEGHGVGPLAPQATNTSDQGRAANRRVVLVLR